MVIPILQVRTSIEVIIALMISVLSLIILPTNHWGQFYLQSSIDVIFEDGRYGFWGFCFLKAPFYVEDCDSEDVVFRVHKKALTAGILSVVHLLTLVIVYLPVRLLSSGLTRGGKGFSSCLFSPKGQLALFLKFGAAFVAACMALAVAILMSSATDAPSYYKLERDWCYYTQFAVLALDVLLLLSAAKELVDEIDQQDKSEKDKDHLRRKEITSPTAAVATSAQPDKTDEQSIVSVTNIDDFTVYSAPGTTVSKEGMYQPLNAQRGQTAQPTLPPMQGSPKATEVVHYVNEGVTASETGPAMSTRSVLSEAALAGQRPPSNLIEMSPSPDAEMHFLNDSLAADGGRSSFVSPGPPSEEGSEHQFTLSPTPTPVTPGAPLGPISASPGIPPPPPPPPPPPAVVAQGTLVEATKTLSTQDYQVPSSNPVVPAAPALDTPKGPFGFVLPPLKFKPKNYDDSDEPYNVPRGQDNYAFQAGETAAVSIAPPPQHVPTSVPNSSADTPAPSAGAAPPPPPPPPPPPGWQPPH